MKKVSKGQTIRQGDIMLVPVSEGEAIDWIIAPRVNPSDRVKGGRVIIAFGEVTGHAHAIKGNSNLMVGWTRDPMNRWQNQPTEVLEVGDKAVTLQHEEHEAFRLPAGERYRIVQQREYDPRAVRAVRD